MGDAANHPAPGLGPWFAEDWGLFVTMGIVVGFALWLARDALMVGAGLGCFAFVTGCVVGMTRWERLETKDQAER